MLNNSVIMGRLVANPELKITPQGTEVTSFTVAVERNYAKQGEERQADFIDCVAWRNTAKFITTYFRKGSMIAIVGEIQTRMYEDKSNNKRKAVEVIVNHVSFCGSKTDNKPNLNVTANESELTPPSQSDFEEIDVDDLPF